MDDDVIIVEYYTVTDGGAEVGQYESVRSYSLYPRGETNNYSAYVYDTNDIAVSDALVNGDITINVGPNVNVLNDIYGGGKNGAISGDIVINIEEGVTFNNNIYVGGEGSTSTINATMIDYFPLIWTGVLSDNVVTIEKFEFDSRKDGTIFSNAPSGWFSTPFMTIGEFNGNYSSGGNPPMIYSDSIARFGKINGNTTINMNGNSVNKIFGGSYGEMSNVTGTSTINVNQGTIGEIYGGGDSGNVGNTVIMINGGTVTQNIFGGCNKAKVNGNTEIIINSGTIANIYGGGNNGDVMGKTNVTINDGVITESIFGGGNNSQTYDETKVYIKSGKVTNVFGGGNNGDVLASGEVLVDGGDIGFLYGGGNYGDVANSIVRIAKGTFEEVYGGGNIGTVLGNTIVFVGSEDNNYPINITSILYGGGKGINKNYVTVDGASNVTVKGYNTYVKNFGSSSIGKVNGEVNVTFKDYWTGNSTDKYKVMNGIDKATNVIFDNSYVELENKAGNGSLEGIKDIYNLYVNPGSGLKVSANSEIRGDFHGGGTFFLNSGTCMTVDKDIYGETNLVIRPENTQDGLYFKGTRDYPYFKIKGTDYSINNKAFYSTDSRYEVVHGMQSGYNIYYIDVDLLIEEIIKNVVQNKKGEDYTGNSAIWSIDDVSIKGNEKFSSEIETTFKDVFIPRLDNSYKHVTRSLALVTNDNIVTFPANSIVKLYENGTLYSYRVGNNMSSVPLSYLTNTNNTSRRYKEKNDLTEGTLTSSVENGNIYNYSENFRIIVDFSEVPSSKRLAEGPYNFMINYFDDDVALNNMQDEAINILRIESVRNFEGGITLENDYCEPHEDIRFSINIKSPRSEYFDENYGKPVYAVVSLIDPNGNTIRLLDEIETFVEGENVPHTNSNVKFKAFEQYTENAINETNNVKISFRSLAVDDRFSVGKYKIRAEYYVCQPNGDSITKLVSFQNQFDILKFKLGAIYATVTGSGISKTDLLKLKSSNPSRTITIKYIGDLKEPYIEIVAQKQVSGNTYETLQSNSFTVNRINNVVEDTNSVITMNRGSAQTGRYKLILILRDKGNNEKAREEILFEVE